MIAPIMTRDHEEAMAPMAETEGLLPELPVRRCHIDVIRLTRNADQKEARKRHDRHACFSVRNFCPEAVTRAGQPDKNRYAG